MLKSRNVSRTANNLLKSVFIILFNGGRNFIYWIELSTDYRNKPTLSGNFAKKYDFAYFKKYFTCTEIAATRTDI